jgi:hypothetical protein
MRHAARMGLGLGFEFGEGLGLGFWGGMRHAVKVVVKG